MSNVQYMQLIAYLAHAAIQLNAQAAVVTDASSLAALNTVAIALTNALKTVAAAGEADPAANGSVA